MHHRKRTTPSQPVVSRPLVHPGTLHLALLSLPFLAVYILIARIPDHIVGLNRYLILYAIAFILYVISILISRTLSDSRRMLVLILFPALLFRLIFLTTWPTLSTDYYRYRWDGKVAASGINPYLHNPRSPKLEHLRDARWHWINHRQTNTPYPPVSQVIFALAYKLSPNSPLPFKLILLLFETIAILLILRMLGHFGLPRSRIIIYAWCPLVVLETYSSAHQDIIGLAFMWAALYLAVVSTRHFAAGAAFAAASLVKYFTLPLLPLFLHKKACRFMAGMAVVTALLYLPYLEAGTNLFSGFIDYAEHWRVQGPVAAVFNRFFGMLLPYDGIHERVLSGLILLVAIVKVALGRPKEIRLLKAAFTISAAIIILVPTFYPWYLLPVVPFLCFFPSSAWVLFTGTAAFCYLLPIYGFSGYIMALEYLPVLVLMIIGHLRGFSRRGAKL